jgi:hypothetical protein
MTNAEITELETRIGPAARCPLRRHRQHPYQLHRGDGQAVREAIRDDAGEVVQLMDAAIRQAVWRAYRWDAEQTREDVRQDVRMYLVSRVVPAFDQTANSKLSTFAYLCIGRFVVGKVWRRKAQVASVDPSVLDRTETKTTTTAADFQVERIAAAVLDNPVLYLGHRAGEATRRIASGETLKAVAEDMGVAAGTLCMSLKRARERLLEHDIHTAELLG